MRVKDGSCYSPTMLAWVRRQPCSFGHLHPAGEHHGGEAHHYPGKGRSGVTRDDKTCPVCRACHMRCEGQRVAAAPGRVLEPIPELEQERAVHIARSRFLEEANLLERKQFFRDMETWAEAREALLPVPF